MAGDWIKMDCSTPEKPEVLAIAAALGWDDADFVVGKLFKLWRWFDQHTVDGNARSVTPALLDKQIGVTGFVQKVADVGWLEISNAGICLKDFDKHNGNTAKSRALGAKRAASARSNAKSNAGSNAPSVTVALPREEKRREEYSVPNGTAAKAALKPEEIIFGYGLPMLTNAGTPEKQARSFLGGLRKAHGDQALIDKLRDCLREKPMQPLEWLAAALPPVGKGGSSHHNKQTLLEARNRAIAADWAANHSEVSSAVN